MATQTEEREELGQEPTVPDSRLSFGAFRLRDLGKVISFSEIVSYFVNQD